MVLLSGVYAGIIFGKDPDFLGIQAVLFKEVFVYIYIYIYIWYIYIYIKILFFGLSWQEFRGLARCGTHFVKRVVHSGKLTQQWKMDPD